MLIAGRLFHPDHAHEPLRLGWLRLEGPRIVSVQAGEPPTAPDLGDDECVIFPGFIDAHVHLPQFDSIGVAGLELLDWLERVIFPAEARWADPGYAGEMAERVTYELISFGTTGFAAYGSVHSASVREAFQRVADCGVRAWFGPSLMDRHAPAELCPPAGDQIAALASMSPAGRVYPAVTPRFAIACTPALLRSAGEVAEAKGWPIQTHLSETQAELALIAELFDGRPYAQVYDEFGLLTPRTILGHGIWLSEEERSLLAARRSVVAHCPTANRFLDAGLMQRAALNGAGVRLALGSDVAGGPDRSMVRVARAMIETAVARGDRPPTPAEAFRQITLGNAEALGWPQSGRLAPGCEADLLVVRPRVDFESHPDPLGAMLYGWDERWIEQTIVAGVVGYDARW